MYNLLARHGVGKKRITRLQRLSMLSSILTRAFSDRRRMAPHPRFSFLGRACSTLSTMCSGCFHSTVTGKPNVFGQTTTSPRTCGTLAASTSWRIIVFQLQGLSLHSIGSNGSSTRAVNQHRQQLLRGVLPLRWLILKRYNMMKQTSERKLGRPAGGPDRRPGCGAPGTSLIS